MILGKSEIEKRIKEENLLENHLKESVGGAGYDLRVGAFYGTSGDSFMSEERRVLPNIREIPEDTLLLKPGQYVLIETVEKVNMPKDLAARVLNRSSIFRCGASTFNALVDPGYSGTLTFGLKNISDHDFSVERGTRIAQIVFEEVGGETSSYDGKYQGGKVV